MLSVCCGFLCRCQLYVWPSLLDEPAQSLDSFISFTVLVLFTVSMQRPFQTNIQKITSVTVACFSVVDHW